MLAKFASSEGPFRIKRESLRLRTHFRHSISPNTATTPHQITVKPRFLPLPGFSSSPDIPIMATANWRTINVDLFDPESPANFSVTSLLPAVAPVSASEVQQLSSQIRQLLRGGDTEGALRGALENAPYGGDAQAKVWSYCCTSTTKGIAQG